jgi:hypothetical protein
MSQELHYTSVSRGLNPGSRGFCTVACTSQMPGPLVERLEGLSGYQPVYPVHDAAAVRNPINFSHLKLTIRGNSWSVLSRIGPAGLDYSGRSNKYAHHVVLEPNERPEGGPAWLLSHPGFLQATWEGEPRVLTERRTPPRGDRPGGVARAWQALTGDAGWAGVLAESFLAEPKRPAFLIFQPGMDLLPLFVEAMALLPAQRRWDVEFSTYFTTLPQGVTCHWRGVVEGSPEAIHALRLPNTLVINLRDPAGHAEGRELVNQARTGEQPESPLVDTSASSARSPRKGAASGAKRPIPIPVNNPSRGLPPSPPTNTVRNPKLGTRQRHTRRRPKRNWALAMGICTVCLVAMAGIAFVLFRVSQGPEPEVVRTRELAHAGPVAIVEEARAPSDNKTPKKTEGDFAAKPANKSAHEETPKKTQSAPAQKLAKNLTPGPDASKAKTEPVDKTIKLLFFDLPEPKSNSLFFDTIPTPGTSTLDLAGSTATKLELLDLKRGINAKTATLGLVGRQVAKGGLDVMIRESDGTTGKEHALAHFKLEGGKVHFEWDDDPSNNGRAEARDRLRDCVLKITMNDGKMRYSLLRKGPDAIPGPLRIRMKADPGKTKPNNANPFATFKAVQSKPFKLIDWGQRKEHAYLHDDIVIVKLKSDLLSSDGKDFVRDGEKDEWSYEGDSNHRVVVKFDKNENQIRFTFEVPNPLEDEDRDVIEKLLDASYSVVLGLKIDGQIVEMARIGSFTPAPKEVSP